MPILTNSNFWNVNPPCWSEFFLGFFPLAKPKALVMVGIWTLQKWGGVHGLHHLHSTCTPTRGTIFPRFTIIYNGEKHQKRYFRCSRKILLGPASKVYKSVGGPTKVQFGLQPYTMKSHAIKCHVGFNMFLLVLATHQAIPVVLTRRVHECDLPPTCG